MSSTALALLRRVARAPGVAAGLAWWRLRHDPVWLLLKAADAVPVHRRMAVGTGLLCIASGVLRRHPSSVGAAVAAAFALVQTGDDVGLEALIARRMHRAGRRERVALARLLTEAGDPVAALDLLRGAAATPAVLEARGRAHAGRGALHDALRDLGAAAAAGSAAAAVEHARTDGLVRATSPDWQAHVPAIQAVSPVRGRVLHLLNNSLPHVVAGYTVRTHRVAQAQRAAGLQPVMVTRAGFPVLQGVVDAGPNDRVDGITYHRLPAEGLARRGMAAQIDVNVAGLAPLLTEHRPAVLHPTSPFDNARAALALRSATGLPVVYEVRGFLEETWRSSIGDGAERSDRYRRTRAIEGWCMREADRVVTLGEAMRADIIGRGVDPGHVVVIPNAVDPDDFVPRRTDPALRAHLGFDAGDVVLGYVSSLVGYEGVGHLLSAIALLRARGRPVKGLIVGDGVERAALQHITARLGIGDDVRFAGRVPVAEVQRWYAQIDVFVVPRTNDRVARAVTPLKPLEAMALERAVVTSDVPALRELIDPGVTGLLFDAEDPVSLADTVEPLLDDPGARARLGAAAREWVASERTWRHNGARYRRLYAELGAV
jgi:PEP-CTERM/exosortase A-associated glycosyltransferase